MIIVCGYAEFVGGGYSGDAHAGGGAGELTESTGPFARSIQGG